MGYKNLGHKQECSPQIKGAITKAHLNAINSGEHAEGVAALKKKYAGNKDAIAHIKNNEKTFAENWEP